MSHICASEVFRVHEVKIPSYLTLNICMLLFICSVYIYLTRSWRQSTYKLGSSCQTRNLLLAKMLWKFFWNASLTCSKTTNTLCLGMLSLELTDISVWNPFLESDMKNSGAGHEHLGWKFLLGVAGKSRNPANSVAWACEDFKSCNSANRLKIHCL